MRKTKVEYLYKPDPKQQCLELCDKIRTTMSLHMVRQYTEELTKTLKER